jgi:hypothetical protein
MSHFLYICYFLQEVSYYPCQGTEPTKLVSYTLLAQNSIKVITKVGETFDDLIGNIQHTE